MRQLENSGNAAWTAPLVVPLALILVSFVVDRGFTELHALAVALAAFVSYVGLFSLGYPLATLLDRRGLLSMWTLAAIGAICGFIVGALAPLAFQYFLGSYQLLPVKYVLLFAGFGVLVAVSFGLMAKVRWSSRRA